MVQSIRGLNGLTLEEIDRGVADGRRFVFYECCISLVVFSIRRPSDIYFLGAHELGLMRAVPWIVITLLLGWWGLPWGIIYTPLALVTNLGGGRDVTDEVLAWLHTQAAAPTTGGNPCDPSFQAPPTDLQPWPGERGA
jgi:hypothetical protein